MAHRYALVHDWMAVFGGAEEMFRHVCELYEGPIFTSQFNPAAYPFLKGREVRTTWIDRMPLAHTKHYVYAPFAPGAYRSMDFGGFDALLVDSHSFAHHVRKPAGAKMLCYYHTPIRSLWMPEVDKRMSGFPQSLFAPRMRAADLAASRTADVVLANSETTAERIRRFYGREPHAVVYPPVDTQKWSGVERKSDEEGMLMWGRLIPYKRVDLGIEAARATGIKLNIVGNGPMRAALEQQAQGLKHVVFHGRLDDPDLMALMERSLCTLFPAYEDFGIVPVESLAAGLPVVALGAGGSSETVTPECGVQIHEQTGEALAAGVLALQGRTFDAAVLKAQAARFDAEVFRSRYQAAVAEMLS